MSRRDQIEMTGAEVAEFLAEQRTVICATNGRKGWPHLMPLWYVVRAGELWAWTYAKSQKARNVERDPRATLAVETGEAYAQLRGVMIEADTTIHRELATVTELGAELLARYGEGSTGADFTDVVRRQASKRVVLQFAPLAYASWDHRKLAGTY